MTEEPVGAVFSALSDPMRREVVRRLTEHGPMTATQLAQALPVSRQAVAKHLARLSSAGLVEAERDGREVRFHLTPAPMADATAWMAEAGAEWDERLARLKRRMASKARRRS